MEDAVYKPELPEDPANISVPLISMVCQLIQPTAHAQLMRRAVLCVNEECDVSASYKAV